MKHTLAAVTVVLSLALLAACGGGEDDAASATPTGEGTPASGTPATAAATTPATPLATESADNVFVRTPRPVEGPFEGSQEPVEGTPALPSDEAGFPELVDVRAAAHTGYDRIVFEFSGAPPGYRVEYVTDPSDCGSGAPSFGDARGGGAYLQVRFDNANAHNEAGSPTFASTEITMPDGGIARQTCDFEAVVTWVVLLSRSAPRDFRVAPLYTPTRLVVDISQQ